MFKEMVNKVFGTHSVRELKAIAPIVNKIEALADEYKKLSDEALRAKTEEFKKRLADSETLDDILPEAFATVREAADRVIGLRPYRVQLIGGIVLHQGRIAEMKTGEGKTLVAVLPSYLNALSGKGVHIVTVNDYLARRDSEWMGKVHHFLGLRVGLIVHGLSSAERREAYAADITYGTNNEMGFDYLRDNMALYAANMVQRGHSFAIVDEVDSILIDEARTPLIISGQGDESTDLYVKVDEFVSKLKKKVYATIDDKQEEEEDLDADYVIDEKARTATLTSRGIAKAEQYFSLENLADLENNTLSHHINQAIKAHGVMQLDVDYVIKDGEIIIVDEFTGRLMFGRRYNEGLHQAIEAKEHVKVAQESKTLATITFQNYFRLYDKLSGMTGTALTEEEEFGSIYNLDIIEIPTNKPMVRHDHADVIYKTENGKYKAVINQIEECHKKGQPVLVGTVSIEKSELLSSMLKKRGVPHNVLNAKNHEKEAEIVAQAGKFGTVTIATNMAGRGTDIMLGGNAEYMARNDLKKAGHSDEIIVEATGYADTDNEEIIAARKLFHNSMEKYKAATNEEAEKVKEAGGLFILGTERHESRRIDNQLRGRAGRQGDPGESRFYIALSDDIMRLFGSERIMNMMETLGLDEDTPIDQKILSNAIEQAQKKVESRNFQSRKHVLEYDDVMNTQRTLIYAQRRKVLDGEDIKANLQGMINDVIETAVSAAVGEHDAITDQDVVDEIVKPFEQLFLRRSDIPKVSDTARLTHDELKDLLYNKAIEAYEAKEKDLGLLPGTETPLMRELERVIMLRVVDEYWMEHIDAMEELRDGVRLRAYGQINPVDEYKREGYDMFEAMIGGIKEEVVRRLFIARVKKEQTLERRSVAKNQNAVNNAGGDDSVKPQPVKKAQKPGRNDPCPCGKKRPNGLPMKYKDCCGRDE
ncbi:preprotein translocase subunit SecA [Sporobacter termitidis DSM 10068]|uniref:Protein translocase subunit SecA n=1 Tax=Sporobacter termitidis DSM 10068 TaxID=1123282 RepID=A0A1M5YLV1_9FIRM|nr:preprotein translocase subunit SecA [Sporobacter termitidis]SHI13067.1 preprotein translocase subunit SecA [Sporobacter termitidis DSM 10068]